MGSCSKHLSRVLFGGIQALGGSFFWACECDAITCFRCCTGSLKPKLCRFVARTTCFPPDSWEGMRTLKPDGHESAKSPRLLLRAVFICDRELRESLSDG